VKPNHKSRGNKRQGKAPTGSNLEARIRTEGRGRPNQGEEGGKEKMKAKEASEQATHENTEIPSNKREQGGSASPMEGGNEDANTPMQKVDRDDTKRGRNRRPKSQRHCGKGRNKSTEHTGAMEKTGSRQCGSGATRSHPISLPPKGGSEIQKDQAHA
jgi:hypothetical protein